MMLEIDVEGAYWPFLRTGQMPTKRGREQPKNKSTLSSKGDTVASVSWPTIVTSPYKPVPEITTILPSQILTLNLLSSSFSQQFLSFCQSHITPLLVTTPTKPKKGDAVRFNDRFQTLDQSFADSLWTKTGLKEAIEAYQEDGKTSQDIWGGTPVGLYSNIRVYRYLKGQFFDKHYDDSNTIEFSVEGKATRCFTTYTLLIYLTSSPPIVGGETVFYTEATKTSKGEEIVVNPQQGMALLHAHGSACLLHEGREVTEDADGLGKWILRSDLVVLPK